MAVEAFAPQRRTNCRGAQGCGVSLLMASMARHRRAICHRPSARSARACVRCLGWAPSAPGAHHSRREHRPCAARQRPARCRRRSMLHALGLPGRARGPCRPISTMSLQPGGFTARPIARARLRCTVTAAGIGEAGQDVGHDASPSSPRGLSSVTIDLRGPGCSAMAAICGRLPLSRSPPQPNTQNSRALQVSRAGVSAPVRSASRGVCA